MNPFDPQDPKQQAAQAAVHKEMERVSRDTIMVYNPTSEDFRVEWDGFYHIVPSRNKDMGFGKGKRELERFLARKYVTQMKDLLINSMAESKGKELLDKRKAEGKEPLLDKYFENREIWDKVPRTDDPKLMETIFTELWLGVVRPYGADLPEDKTYGDGKVDRRTIEERLFERMNQAYVPAEEQIEVVKPEEIVKPIVNENVKKKLVSEVAA